MRRRRAREFIYCGVAASYVNMKSMKTWLALAVLGCIPSLAMAGIRCGNQIIDKGKSSAEVSAFCGNPAQVDRSVLYTGGATTVGQPNLIAGSTVQIEVWTYNFGPNMLMERIRFADGVVVNIESLGYGYNEP
jgi:uncharacterized protein DUF2845